MLQLRRSKAKSNFIFFVFYIFLLIIIPFSGRAAYFEPYLGHLHYTLNQDRGDKLDPNVKTLFLRGNRWGAGLRYGPSFKPLFLGIDISYFPMKRLDSVSEGVTSETFFFFGPTIGYQLEMIPLRAWFTFNYIDRYRYAEGKTFSGKSLKAGVGVQVSPKCSFNFEYSRHIYSRDELSTGVTHLPTSDDRYNYEKPSMTSILVSLSLPIW